MFITLPMVNALQTSPELKKDYAPTIDFLSELSFLKLWHKIYTNPTLIFTNLPKAQGHSLSLSYPLEDVLQTKVSLI